MSVKSKLSQLFSGHVETAEHHVEAELRTHYYKTTKDRMMKELNRIFNENERFEVVAQSAERGEITVNVHGKKLYYLVVSVIMVRPFRTAVDFTVTAKRGMDFGFGRKIMASLYESLARSFEYIGTGEN
ncbi:MAG TPA: cytosolic protein [Bacillales bacterium]|nr:cytosolic protein [Bacillales bacterium]